MGVGGDVEWCTALRILSCNLIARGLGGQRNETIFRASGDAVSRNGLNSLITSNGLPPLKKVKNGEPACARPNYVLETDQGRCSPVDTVPLLARFCFTVDKSFPFLSCGVCVRYKAVVPNQS